ncbi:MAG: hypothetical protein DI528_22950 [Shinella sp.]|nr:MAG: hypothetical protein DI528_22950 [Shinella sp.]
MTKLAKSALLALFLFLVPAGLLAADGVRFDRSQLRIDTPEGESHEFQVELALSPEQRERGLMYREKLGDNEGMIFDFGLEREVMMWMKNTPLSLDMLFIDGAGRVQRVASRAVPYSESIIASGGPARFVLEIRGGRAAELGIAPGAQVSIAATASPSK